MFNCQAIMLYVTGICTIFLELLDCPRVDIILKLADDIVLTPEDMPAFCSFCYSLALLLRSYVETSPQVQALPDWLAPWLGC